MTEKELKQAIRQVVKEKYLGRKVDFKTPGDDSQTFKVAAFKISTRKNLIPKSEWEDYGVDERTQTFVVVEFWDAEDEYEVMDCTSCILTLNDKGQVGTADAPFDFELEVAYDTAIELADQITEHFKKGGKA